MIFTISGRDRSGCGVEVWTYILFGSISMSSVRFFKNLAWSRGLRVKFSKSKAPDQGWLRKSTKFGTLKKSGSARSKSLIFYRRFPLDVESDSRVSKVGAWSPFQSEIKSYKVPPICGHRCALWWVFLNFCENGSTRRWQNMRKTRQKALKMCICLSCIALELFAAKIGGWEMGPHVRSGNFSKISSIFDACLSSGDHFFSKMSLTLQIANSTHRSGHQD